MNVKENLTPMVKQRGAQIAINTANDEHVIISPPQSPIIQPKRFMNSPFAPKSLRGKICKGSRKYSPEYPKESSPSQLGSRVIQNADNSLVGIIDIKKVNLSPQRGRENSKFIDQGTEINPLSQYELLFQNDQIMEQMQIRNGKFDTR